MCLSVWSQAGSTVLGGYRAVRESGADWRKSVTLRQGLDMIAACGPGLVCVKATASPSCCCRWIAQLPPPTPPVWIMSYEAESKWTSPTFSSVIWSQRWERQCMKYPGMMVQRHSKCQMGAWENSSANAYLWAAFDWRGWYRVCSASPRRMVVIGLSRRRGDTSKRIKPSTPSLDSLNNLAVIIEFHQ